MNYPPQRHLLQRKTGALLYSVTGRNVTDEWADRVIRFILDGHTPADPWRYIRGAILGSGDPAREFLPTPQPPPFAHSRRHPRQDEITRRGAAAVRALLNDAVTDSEGNTA